MISHNQPLESLPVLLQRHERSQQLDLRTFQHLS